MDKIAGSLSWRELLPVIKRKETRRQDADLYSRVIIRIFATAFRCRRRRHRPV